MLDSNLNIVGSELVRFDSDLPHYKTKDGVYRDPSINGRIVSPTLMWVEALDLILSKLSDSNFDHRKIAAVSGSGQQHGTNALFKIFCQLGLRFFVFRFQLINVLVIMIALIYTLMLIATNGYERR